MKVNINGCTHEFPDPLNIATPFLMATIDYEHLCLIVGIDPKYNPSAMYSLPDGRGGCIYKGKPAPLVEGAIYNIMGTGNA